jgi:hypothetical protein
MVEYQHLTADELLHLAEGREQFTDEARLALEAELSRRKLSPPDIESYRLQRESAEKADKLKRGARGYIPDVGLGKKFLGKTNRHRDPSGLFEQYDTTLWFVVLWFPVFPSPLITVQKRPRTMVRHDRCRSGEIPIDRHPRNWEQILLTWVKAAACPARPSSDISVAAAPP